MSQVFVLFLIGYFENLGCFVLKLFFLGDWFLSSSWCA
jgi:hypothetical protein